jgi:polyketide synthase PksN
MDNQLALLFDRIKNGEISHKDAAIQFKLLENKQTFNPNSSDSIELAGSKSLQHQLQLVLRQIVSKLLRVTLENIDINEGFEEYGFDQPMLSVLVNELNNRYGIALTPAIFFENSDIFKITKYLAKEHYNLLAKHFQTEAPGVSDVKAENKPCQSMPQDQLRDKASHYFKKSLSSILKLPMERIDVDAPMEKYGIDSIMVNQLTNQLEKTFGPLSKTLFFEYQNIQELTGYFIANYQEQLIKLLGIGANANVAGINNGEPVSLSNSPNYIPRRRKGFSGSEKKGNGDIAIIGLSGRYPGANNVGEYWDNLREGKDCITEIPKERWDHSLYYDEDKNKPGSTYCKWGGFIDGVDQFDPLFFNISPHEASIIDPQERLFLECVYATLEDAGYTKESLGRFNELGLGGNVGVFVGVMYEEYQLYGVQEQTLGRPIALSGSPASIANRISYYFNLHGPSMALDTMCSSSLTAIHLACKSLQQGGEVAIAGGVNISIHPNKFLTLGQGKFASSTGHCESFGVGGDGYVPGEGVGAIMLKPLSKAEEDGDHIYGVIKCTAINHGGKANGYTVPNPNAQASVIAQALKGSGINPRAISYIEAHGTGTSLGDPIEITGLTKAFRKYTNDKQYCAIGSAKSNIGHCESAAGIAAVTKVLLQLKHSQIAPSLHSKELNPNIDFSNTPFVVQQGLAEWKRPIFEDGGITREYPRIAGISSFGAGGANAHIIIEEYAKAETSININAQNPAIIVLSARDEERLHERVRQILNAIGKQQIADHNLAAVAYTLQVGREAMEERLAVMVNSVQALEEKLRGFLGKQDGIDDLYCGQVKRDKDMLTAFTADDELKEAVDKWIQLRKYHKILGFWVKGLAFDWQKIYCETRPCRISLPTYPFARERYWAPDIKGQTVSPISTAIIHPLLHQNTSDVLGLQFSSTFTGHEFFLAHHVVNGQKILPGVAYLEMAHAATKLVTYPLDGQLSIHLKNIVWVRPIAVNGEPVKVNISLYPEDNGEIAFEIYTPGAIDEGQVLHGQGYASHSHVASTSFIDINALEAGCNLGTFSHEQCYDTFKSMGIDYGLGHKCIEQLFIGQGQVLAKLTLQSGHVKDQYILHPALMDSAIQASIGLLGIGGLENPHNLKPKLPFALEQIEVMGGFTTSMWALVRYSQGCSVNDKIQKLDIDLCDDQGKICVSMRGYSSRVLEEHKAPVQNIKTHGTVIMQPTWKEKAALVIPSSHKYEQHLVVLCEQDSYVQQVIERQMEGAHCLILQSKLESIDQQYQTYAVALFETLQAILKNKPKGKVLVQVVVPNNKEPLAGFSGMLKTAHLENPIFIGQLIALNPGEPETIIEKLKENVGCPDDHICYINGKRSVLIWNEIKTEDETTLPWKDSGVYLITGGAGGIGLIFAKEIAQKAKNVTLILTGRSPLCEEKQKQIKELETLGITIQYQQVDITYKESVDALIQSIVKNYGFLSGIIHSAGIIKDNFIIKKSTSELEGVLSPKVCGLVNLDRASKGLPLDFFVFFSSMTGALGNIGQVDYALANAFMDGYAFYRNALVSSQGRHGKTLSINWPLWLDGGMHIDDGTRKMMQSIGLDALQNADGINAFYRALASDSQQAMVVEGNIAKIHKTFLGHVTDNLAKLPLLAGDGKSLTHSQLWEKAALHFKKSLSSVLKLSVDRIDADAPMENYGIDSVMVTQLTSQLEKTFGPLSKTLFFEYQNIGALTNYFIENHRSHLVSLLGLEEKAGSVALIADIPMASSSAANLIPRRRKGFSLQNNEKKGNGYCDIAIIGLSGRYPRAKNVGEYWDNLREGKDCITEIPKERWDHSLYYDEEKGKPGSTYCKWGGFMEGVEQFDPLFFNISPHEAAIMDPQERLFLECVHATLEDAGYTKEALSQYQGLGLEGNVGVFVGVMYEEYQLYGAQEQTLGRPIALSGSPASIANRVSYYFNLHGPSIALDTMCSSSLTAIHLACKGIQQGGCELAIAGGVNISIHPNKYLSLGQGEFASSTGHCESFGVGGDGYVPGEGVGAIMLKPLSKAEEDGDHIYGVIKGTAINHGGKTNGYTVPNPSAQASVIAQALKESGINPRAISYIEAHGTGTSLGDPIEIAGLTKTFREYTNDNQYCAIGSAKSNIGHCESASGIAGITKVLMQLKYCQIAPSLHSRELNPNIDFGNTPFVVQQELAEWKRPVVEDGGMTKEYPRIAGISSFGAGGANAHVVIEEYIPKGQSPVSIGVENPAIVVLSAKNEDRLGEQVKQILYAIKQLQITDDNLAAAAYTLQTGREAMEERLALLVASVRELEEKLKGFLNKQDGIEGLYHGQVKRNKVVLAAFAVDDELREAIDKWALRGKYDKILGLWADGLAFDWQKLYGGTKPSRMSLPTYPFAREHYWVPYIKQKEKARETFMLQPVWKEQVSLGEMHPKETLKEKTLHQVKVIFGEITNIKISRIDHDEALESYGIDSVMITRLNQKLTDVFEELSKTLFYEHKTLGSLAEYLSAEFPQICARWTGFEEHPSQSVLGHKEDLSVLSPLKNIQTHKIFNVVSSNSEREPIAIIGISGQYPKAKTLEEYWDNLKSGKDCISEIPGVRWPMDDFYISDHQEAIRQGKSYSRWGGFVEGYADFDPLFFNISPRESATIDPQERLFVESCWAVIEDAGYTKEQLVVQFKQRIGVFAGITKTGYNLYGPDLWHQGEQVFPRTSFGSVANRVSYLLNLKGPSIPIDTMCSSSLTAIHEACEHLLQGACEMAIAGGVNLYLHPSGYVELCTSHMLSGDGQCKSFGKGGNGFVPGEGVGTVLLKQLSKAIRDEDHIYALIKGSAINHGGKTNGYMVPSPVAQGELIRETFDKAGVNARMVSYIEAHGTGTELGDPIEITGLKQAFQPDTEELQFCPIGSVKSNIGHLEAAAGIAGITKIVLQMQNQQLVPSLHSKELNPNINFPKTPFVVQQGLTEWQRPVIEVNGVVQECPRIAGISSFGAGGANAHIVIEEYITQAQPTIIVDTQNPAIIVLSAKNEDRLREQARQILQAIEKQRVTDLNLADAAFTLQTGREAMEERLAVIVTSVHDLREKLKSFVDKQDSIEGLYRGQVKRNKDMLAVFAVDEDMSKTLQAWINKRKYAKLLDLWVKGLVIEWQQLYGETMPRRISLPTYPFAREHYWVPESAKPGKQSNVITAIIHPLLHRNTSDFSEQRFSSTFTGNEFFLAHHVVKGQKTLPGVAYLEMARAATQIATGTGHLSIQLKNVVWMRPITVNGEPVQVNIGLFPEDNGYIAYEIYTQGTIGQEQVTHSQGIAILSNIVSPVFIDIHALMKECNLGTLSSEQCYKAFKSMGIDYGIGHQCIEQVFIGQGQVLAKLKLTSAYIKDQYILHPAIMDSALQAAIGLAYFEGIAKMQTIKATLPFALEQIEVLDSCTPSMWALIMYSKGSSPIDKVQKLDINLCDDLGKICVRMKGYSSRILEGEIALPDKNNNRGTLILQPIWKEEAVSVTSISHKYTQRLVVLCEQWGALQNTVENKMDGVRCLTLQSMHDSIDKRYQAYVVQLFESIKAILKSKPEDKVLIQVVVTNDQEHLPLHGLSGMLKTAHLENPKIIGQLIALEHGGTESIIEKLEENSRCSDSHVRYIRGKRSVLGWDEIKTVEKTTLSWKDGGIYLITGGAGGLGLIFAKEIAQKAKSVTLILTGRSPLGEERQTQLKELEGLGIAIQYQQVDVTDKKSVESLIQYIMNKFGALHGIIHSAGVIHDNFIIRKTKEEIELVLAPKVSGLVNLDMASKGLQLDFFVFFSSTAGALGNIGQVDYSLANAFMDSYASYRNALVSSQLRYGQTLSINWPLWKEGGMHIDEETEKMINGMGLDALQIREGIQAFYSSMALGSQQVMVMEGNLMQIKQKLGLTTIPAVPAPKLTRTSPAALDIEKGSVSNKINKGLAQHVSQLLKVKIEDIDPLTDLNEYGFDSITLTQFSNILNQQYKIELAPTIFFEHSTLDSFARYLIEAYPAIFTPTIIQQEGLGQVLEEEMAEQPSIKTKPRQRFISEPMQSSKPNKGPSDIAIVGMSGKFPMSSDLNEFWKNLLEGKDCISEIPKDRWNWREYYGDPVKEADKTNIKWGGFMDRIDDFDPQFFGISPREAMFMDPQQRLLMTYVWKVIEDAGYSAQSLSGTKTGIYVGTANSGYNTLMAKAGIPVEGYTSTGAVSSVGPNRMSYFLDLHGPSEPIETACSSSLIAIHQAVCAIENGTCEMAIVGGVNTIVAPEAYISFNKAGMLAEDGRCKTFSSLANGYVRGEGVGMLFLKRLKDAEQAGDNIYGIIRGTAENHGGRANSLTSPNPKAQAELLKTAYTKAGIDPRTVTYIEAHGTGTELGDPIEINGLKAAFKELYQATGDASVTGAHCGLGSVKTNIGHLELSAGVAGVIKVLLQLRHKQLVKTLHCDVINPYIQLKDSPFYIIQGATEWKALNDQQGNPLPRRAGISSFGFGGANAHVVIEEYIPKMKAQIITDIQHPVAIVLSAKNEDRLSDQVGQILQAIEKQQITNGNLADAAFTLQIGREAMEERLAVAVSSIEILEEKLKGFLGKLDHIEGLFYGQVKRNKDSLATLTDEGSQEDWIQNRDYNKILGLWVKGFEFDWNKLYGETKPCRISLPTYPFGRERYWVPMKKTTNKDSKAISTQPVFNGSSAFQVDLLPATITEFNFNNIGKPTKIALRSLDDKRMVPEIVAKNQEIILSPVTPSLRDIQNDLIIPHSNGAFSINSLQEELSESLAEALLMQRNEVDIDKKFIDIGLDSITGVEWIQAINTQYGLTVPATKVYDYPTIRDFAQFLEKELQKEGRSLKQPIIGSAPEPICQKSISITSLQEELSASLADALLMQRSDIDNDQKFIEMGLDSIVGVEWIQVVNQQYGIAIPATKIYDYPTISEFAEFLSNELIKNRSTDQPLEKKAPLSLDELLVRIQQGSIDIEQGEKLLYEYHLTEE